MDNEKRIPKEQTFTSFDGTELFYRHWKGKGKKAIVLFHRGHEHSGRLQDVVDTLGMPDYDCFAWDARGLGRSPGIRGYAENFGVFLKDADCFVRHLGERYEIAIKDMAVIAQSVGAVIAAAWVHDYAPDIRCLVLASPALKVKLYGSDFSLPRTLVRGCRWIEGKRREGRVLVHCALGLSRSASVAACWLAWQAAENNIDNILGDLSKRRPGIVLTQEHIANIAEALNELNNHA